MMPLISRWTFRPSQVEERESRATGTVRFESRNRERQVIIPARTPVRTRSGIVFRTLDGVVLAPASRGRPSVLDVVVEAGLPGPQGKVAAGAISVVDPELYALHVSVHNPAPTHGGSRVTVHRITAADYQAARDQATTQAWHEFRRLVGEEKQQRPAGRHIALDTMRLEATVAEPLAATIVGQVAESVELTLHLIATATSVGLEGLRAAAVAHIQAALEAGFELVPGSVSGRVTDAVAEGQAVRYTIEVSARQAPGNPAAVAVH